jgi:hypothetical protein
MHRERSDAGDPDRNDEKDDEPFYFKEKNWSV